jgi:hypothetical protein
MTNSSPLPPELVFFDTIIHKKYKAENQDTMIEEKNEQRVAIDARKVDYLLYRFDDEVHEVFPFFTRIRGLKKMCDYILFARTKKYSLFYVFLIELKNKTGKGAAAQIKAGECFIKFLLDSTQRIDLKEAKIENEKGEAIEVVSLISLTNEDIRYERIVILEPSNKVKKASIKVSKVEPKYERDENGLLKVYSSKFSIADFFEE